MQRRFDRLSRLRTTIWILIAFAFSALVPVAVVDAAPPSSVMLCYVYFGTIADLGWTFTYNQGRLKIHDALSAEFPNTTVQSVALQNVAFLADPRSAITALIDTGCNVVMSNNDMLLGGPSGNLDFASKYPSVQFVLLGENWLTDATPANLLYVANDYTDAFYVAGQAAAAQSTRCIAYLSSWNNDTDPTSSFAGLLLGVRKINATLPVHVIASQSWYNPDMDTRLTHMFIEEVGCDVLLRYSDPFTVDVIVYGTGRPDLYTIGVHSNLQQYVGDSVLTSIYVDWSVVLLPALRSYLVNGSLYKGQVYFPGIYEGAITVARATPRTSSRVASVLNTALAAQKATKQNIICGPLRLRRGGTLQYLNGSNCKVPWSNIGDFITDNYTIQHGEIGYPNSCPAGSWYTYQTRPTITLVCSKCAEGTYSSDTGSTVCTECPPGTSSGRGATSCTRIARLSAGVIGGIVAGCVVAVGAVVAAVALWNKEVERRNAAAPRAPPLALLFTDVEGCAVLWRLHSKAMSEVMTLHDSIIRDVIENNHAYEVRHTDESFVIAASSMTDAAIVAIEIQRALVAARWPSGISFPGESGPCWSGPRVSVAVHWCSETDVTVAYDRVAQRYSYSGPAVEKGVRLSAIGQGGQILMTAGSYETLRSETEYTLLLRDDVTVMRYASDCRLPGSMEPHTLISMTPRELRERRFAPCPTGTPQWARVDGDDLGDERGDTSDDGSHSLSGSTSPFNPSVATTVLLVLLAWMGAGSRKTVTNALMKTLQRYLMSSSATLLSPANAEMEYLQTLKNPKRLAAAVALSISTNIVAGSKTAAKSTKKNRTGDQRRGKHTTVVSPTTEAQLRSNPLSPHL